MNEQQRANYIDALERFRKATNSDVVGAEEGKGVPFYSDWLLRPKNFDLWLSLKQDAPSRMNEYDQMVRDAESKMKEADQAYKKKNPSSGWFGL